MVSSEERHVPFLSPSLKSYWFFFTSHLKYPSSWPIPNQQWFLPPFSILELTIWRVPKLILNFTMLYPIRTHFWKYKLRQRHLTGSISEVLLAMWNSSHKVSQSMCQAQHISEKVFHNDFISSKTIRTSANTCITCAMCKLFAHVNSLNFCYYPMRSTALILILQIPEEWRC